MLLFGFLFLSYLAYRAQDAATFSLAQEQLAPSLGVLYTLLLLTSSLLVVRGLAAFREGSLATARLLVGGAAVCGVAFAVLKVVEYHAKVAEGITPQTNRFFLFYFLLTGMHLLHLTIGLGLLSYFWRVCGRSAPEAASKESLVEGCACFWHMVDLLWLVLFPLLFLVR
jgi:nitric oxide reductase NorE protein